MACILAPRSLPAQDAQVGKKSAELKIDKKAESELSKSNIKKVLQSPTYEVQEEDFDLLEKYLRKFYVPQMTNIETAALTKLPKDRKSVV